MCSLLLSLVYGCAHSPSLGCACCSSLGCDGTCSPSLGHSILYVCGSLSYTCALSRRSLHALPHAQSCLLSLSGSHFPHISYVVVYDPYFSLCHTLSGNILVPLCCSLLPLLVKVLRSLSQSCTPCSHMLSISCIFLSLAWSCTLSLFGTQCLSLCWSSCCSQYGTLSCTGSFWLVCAVLCFLGRTLTLAHSGSHALLLFLWVVHSCMHTLSLSELHPCSFSLSLSLSLPPALGHVCVNVLSLHCMLLSYCILHSLSCTLTLSLRLAFSLSGLCSLSNSCSLWIVHLLCGLHALTNSLWVLCSLCLVRSSLDLCHTCCLRGIRSLCLLVHSWLCTLHCALLWALLPLGTHCLLGLCVYSCIISLSYVLVLWAMQVLSGMYTCTCFWLCMCIFTAGNMCSLSLPWSHARGRACSWSRLQSLSCSAHSCSLCLSGGFLLGLSGSYVCSLILSCMLFLESDSEACVLFWSLGHAFCLSLAHRET